jgi:hypothetical protein
MRLVPSPSSASWSITSAKACSIAELRRTAGPSRGRGNGPPGDDASIGAPSPGTQAATTSGSAVEGVLFLGGGGVGGWGRRAVWGEVEWGAEAEDDMVVRWMGRRRRH